MRRLTAAWACALACGASACGDVDLVDADTGSLITAGSSIALLVASIAVSTETDRSGHELQDRRELRLAIARGTGPFVSDLGAWLELPPPLMPVLGQALRDARPVLLPALSEPIAVATFRTLLGVTLCKEPQLRYHAWKRFDCEQLVPLATMPPPPEPPTPAPTPLPNGTL